MTQRDIKLNILATGFISVTFFIAGCSNTHPPAPLIVLNSQHVQVKDEKATEYVVKKGDTLYAIAWYTGNDYRDIARWNNISSPYNIYPSQHLHLNSYKRTTNVNSNDNNSSGMTSKKIIKNPIDQRDTEEYCDCKENVKNTKKALENKKTTFPDRVKAWHWPASGNVENTASKNSSKSGLDVFSKRNSPIKAAAFGKVVYAGNALRGYGNLVIIKHSEAFLSAYAHNEEILVNEQDWVEAGQQIAKMGSSGSEQVKLHFEIRYRGKSVEPTKYLPKK